MTGLPMLFQSAVRIAVWLKLNPSKYPGDKTMFQSAVRIAVWLKLNDRRGQIDLPRFQSAVRIAVWLKLLAQQHGIPAVARFNPPCGSLFG